MNRRAAILATVVVLALSLPGCGKSSEQVACEQAGGTWDTYVITYTTTMVYNGKTSTPILTPIYGTRCIGGGPLVTSEGMVRDTTDAEVDASILSHLREWWLTVARRDKYPLGHEEVDLLMRVADERDELRRAACTEPDEPHGDPRYVIEKCGACGHPPHGYLLLCSEKPCPCYGRTTQ